MLEVYNRKFSIQVSNCDRYGRLKASELFRFMQECAMEHAELMGAGMETMHKLNRTFVLARMKINVIMMPGIGDELEINTYPFGIERLFYVREFEIKVNNVKSAEAKSLWLVINLDTRRPVRDREFGQSFPRVSNENVNMASPLKPYVPEDAGEIMKIRVGYSDVDILGHANNTAYVAWTCDCIGSAFFKGNPSYSITINYSSELSEGEYVRIIGEDMSFRGISQAGRESFSAIIERL